MEIRSRLVELEDIENVEKEVILKWVNDHIMELHKILETGKCLCGNDLKDSVLFDRGFDTGIECEKCK